MKSCVRPGLSVGKPWVKQPQYMINLQLIIPVSHEVPIRIYHVNLLKGKITLQ